MESNLQGLPGSCGKAREPERQEASSRLRKSFQTLSALIPWALYIPSHDL